MLHPDTGDAELLAFAGDGLRGPRCRRDDHRVNAAWDRAQVAVAGVALLFKFSYMLLVPALSVSSLILGFNMMADGLREMSMRD